MPTVASRARHGRFVDPPSRRSFSPLAHLWLLSPHAPHNELLTTVPKAWATFSLA